MDLVLELHPDRVRSRVVTLTDDHELAAPLRDAGVPVESLGLRGFPDWHRAVRPLRRIIRQWRSDAVHTRLSSSDFAGRLATLGLDVPVLSSIESPVYSDEVRTADASAGRTWKRDIIRGIDIITGRISRTTYIACAPNVAESSGRALRVPPSRMAVVQNSTKVPSTQPASPELDPRAPIRLLTVGKLSEPKGHIHLLRALPRIAEAHPRVHLTVVGGGPYEAQLRQAATDLGIEAHVTWAGFRTDVPQFLRRAHVFVMPSLWEGLSLAVLEAMSAGCAVVTTDIPAMRDVITPGHDGILVPPADASALAAAIEGLLADPDRLQELGRNAWDSALRHFDVSVGAGRLYRLYETVVGS